MPPGGSIVNPVFPRLFSMMVIGDIGVNVNSIWNVVEKSECDF
jgi:hypothetical protein